MRHCLVDITKQEYEHVPSGVSVSHKRTLAWLRVNYSRVLEDIREKNLRGV